MSKYIVARILHCQDMQQPYVFMNADEPGVFISPDLEILRVCEDGNTAQILTDKCNAESDKLLSPHDHECALWSQSACNLSGIMHEFDRIIRKIFYEANLFGHGTEWVNQHPICRLYAEQITHLTRGRDWQDAIDYCERRKP